MGGTRTPSQVYERNGIRATPSPWLGPDARLTLHVDLVEALGGDAAPDVHQAGGVQHHVRARHRARHVRRPAHISQQHPQPPIAWGGRGVRVTLMPRFAGFGGRGAVGALGARVPGGCGLAAQTPGGPAWPSCFPHSRRVSSTFRQPTPWKNCLARKLPCTSALRSVLAGSRVGWEPGRLGSLGGSWAVVGCRLVAANPQPHSLAASPGSGVSGDASRDAPRPAASRHPGSHPCPRGPRCPGAVLPTGVPGSSCRGSRVSQGGKRATGANASILGGTQGGGCPDIWGLLGGGAGGDPCLDCGAK